MTIGPMNKQIIVFGASGDLASLKLFPAIFELFLQKQLSGNFQIIGYARSAMELDKFRELFKKSLLEKFSSYQKEIDQLLERVFYFQGQYNQAQDYQKLESFCQELSKGEKSEQLAYFSVPPVVFSDLIENLANTLKKSAAKFQIIIEKPFGVDEKTAEILFGKIAEFFDEENVFLLDHYLGKRPVQSILKLRMENNVINLMIRPQEIESIEITAFEQNDASTRVGYYDQVGALKDMIQSHLIQILTLITMEIPANDDLESLRREKQSIISALKFSGKASDLLLGQYKSYKSHPGVPENSNTDTFAAVNVQIDKRDWYKVPIRLITGKKLSKALTRATITFKKMPFQGIELTNNKLVFEVKPGESVGLGLVQRATILKGAEPQFEEFNLSQGLGCKVDFCLSEYASLILDALNNVKTYFLSFPEIVAAWKLVDGIEAVRKNENIKCIVYEDGSNGPTFQEI